MTQMLYLYVVNNISYGPLDLNCRIKALTMGEQALEAHFKIRQCYKSTHSSFNTFYSCH